MHPRCPHYWDGLARMIRARQRCTGGCGDNFDISPVTPVLDTLVTKSSLFLSSSYPYMTICFKRMSHFLAKNVYAIVFFEVFFGGGFWMIVLDIS